MITQDRGHTYSARIGNEPTSKGRLKDSPKLISGRFVLLWWIFVLVAAVLVWASPPIALWANIMPYLGLWLLITSGCLFLAFQWSFSAKAGRPLDILEIPIYLSATNMFLINLFGLAAYLDKRYLVLPSVSYLSQGLLLIGAGFLSMWGGYMLVILSSKAVPGRQLPLLAGLNLRTPSYSLTFWTYVGVLILRLVSGDEMLGGQGYLRGLAGDWGMWIGYLEESRWLFVALVALQVFSRRWPGRFLAFILLVESGIAVLSGWSSALPKVLLLVLGCVVYRRQRLPWRTIVPIVLMVTIAVIFTVPVVRTIRASGGIRQDAWSVVTTSVEATWGQGADTGWKFFSDLIVDRQSEIAQTPSLIMYKTPNIIPYLPWQDLAVAPITFIPRAIWPSKPNYSATVGMFSVQYFGLPVGASASAVTMVGNAYMYGGWPVTIIGMFAMGVIAALSYRYLALPGLLDDQVGLLAVYAGMVIANFHIGEVDFVSLWQGLVQRVAVFLLIAYFLCRQKQTADRVVKTGGQPAMSKSVAQRE